MEDTTIQGLKYYKIKSKDIIEQLPGILPEISDLKYVTGHWSAGSHRNYYRSYQINIINEDAILVSSTIDQYMNHQHTWNRNSKNIGYSYIGMYGATDNDMGIYPITKNMIESAGKTLAVLKGKYNYLGWEYFTDHAFFSKRDNYKQYGSMRWDTEFKLENGRTVTEETKNKAQWYFKKYIGGDM